MQQNSKYNLCSERDEIINHISEYRKLAHKKYKIRHDWVGKAIHCAGNLNLTEWTDGIFTTQQLFRIFAYERITSCRPDNHTSY